MNANLKLLKKTKLFLLAFAYLLLGKQSVSNAQYNSTGALLLSPSEYSQLPRPNWDTLLKYSITGSNSNITTFGGATGITMLINPPIGDQGNEGSCVGWSVGYAATSIINYQKYNCWNTAERSPSYVYNQIKVSANCQSGSYIKDALNLVQNQGDCSLFLMPYNVGDCATQPTIQQQNDAAANKAIKWAALDANDVAGIKHALYLGFPVVVGFNVTTSFDLMWSNGGIWNTNLGPSRGGHATCIIGFDETKQMFKVQNQWGTNGGDQGFFWVTYDNIIQNNCLSEAYILYGTMPFVPYPINGDDNFCTTSNSYTIPTLPTGATVTWSILPSNIATLNTNGNSVTLSKNTNGVATLVATFTDVCGNVLSVSSTKTIIVGAGNPPNVTINYDATCGKLLQGLVIVYNTPQTAPIDYCLWTLTGDQTYMPKTYTTTLTNDLLVTPLIINPINNHVYKEFLTVQAHTSCGFTAINPYINIINIGPYNAANCNLTQLSISNKESISLETSSYNKISISPNPANNRITIKVPDEEIGNELQIISPSGNIYHKAIITSNITLVDISKYSNGMYFATIANKSKSKTLKFIKQ